MNPRVELAKALVAGIGEIASSAQRLHVVLKDERAVLASGDDARLLELTGVKTLLLQQLERLEEERTHLLRQLGEDARSVPFAMARALASQPVALTAWDDALKTLAACRLLNDGNGAAVDLRLRQVRQALALLTGAPAGAGVYGPQGVPESLHRSTTLARA